eukprot:2946030-Rhodomonas_salina.4
MPVPGIAQTDSMILHDSTGDDTQCQYRRLRRVRVPPEIKHKKTNSWYNLHWGDRCVCLKLEVLGEVHGRVALPPPMRTGCKQTREQQGQRQGDRGRNGEKDRDKDRGQGQNKRQGQTETSFSLVGERSRERENSREFERTRGREGEDERERERERERDLEGADVGVSLVGESEREDERG